MLKQPASVLPEIWIKMTAIIWITLPTHQPIWQIQEQTHKIHKSIQLLEVFCSPDSELTNQTQNLGFQAIRHGMDQGDLSTADGRKTLFQKVVIFEPKNIFISHD